VDTDNVDAATQSIKYTRCSNATAFILPFLGHNFGVGEEAGSILEALSETHSDWFIFVHENDVTSAMIRSAQVRWDLRVETYATESELISKLRLFAAGGIMHQERRGDPIGWIDWALLKSSSGEYFTPVSISTVDSFCN